MTHRLYHSIIEELSSFIGSKSATFVCGGRVPISNSEVHEAADTLSTPPVTIRWDSQSTSAVSKLVFPIDDSNPDQKASLLKLVDNCQPASFGYKGEDVIDESYRKATKLDCTTFSTDFCPYKLGIIDTIAQMLLPNARDYLGTQGVRAELYKLNIYGAPSGFFKAHVDTPRSTTQFGSLVVCLPCEHEGGQLVVRHAGNSTTFDWGASGSDGKKKTAVQWAAFYSDCEHEVLEVTKGHRITLTYNLFAAPGVGDLAGNSPAMDVKQLPLFKKIRDALQDENFMPKGGYLGVFCQHAYAHSTKEGAKALPTVLKGVDMAVYSVFKRLGQRVKVRPVFDLDNPGLWNDEYDDTQDEDEDQESEENGVKAFVGNSCGQIVVTDAGGYEGSSNDEILRAAPGDWLRVVWLNRPSSTNMSFVHMTYGNQAGVNEVYTSAALIITISPFKDS
ncbi:hypothetical protein yc1106_05215 [Curvularia clavata]|uniref:Fe2OG dioxygenase domain-containing protein n=1 Tax=Curvularia clavata TaxID=95742 RepID=A0A9Q8Z8Z8_CURCL|nr:hypothetical protein yc1106_05215 [Curvularia clavata]